MEYLLWVCEFRVNKMPKLKVALQVEALYFNINYTILTLSLQESVMDTLRWFYL